MTDPGTRYCYSFSVDKLGQVIEAIIGQILLDYIRDNITEPLGMTKTGPHLMTKDYLRCHYKTPDGKVSVTPIVPDPNPYRYGGGHYAVLPPRLVKYPPRPPKQRHPPTHQRPNPTALNSDRLHLH